MTINNINKPIQSGEKIPHENEWYNHDFNGYRVSEQPLHTKRQMRVVCVGAGAAGLDIAYKAGKFLQNVDLQIYEKNSDIGGTWLENRYPGCACDVPSHSYQFTWARNPNWSQFYSSSEEIWRYLKDVSVKHNLVRYVQFNTSVQIANWNEETGQWDLTILSPDGQETQDTCDVLINGSGVLNSWKYPDIPGLDVFKGSLMHSAKWDDSIDLKGKRVAVIGAGSSAIQIIPSIQPRVEKLIPFVRTPSWITPGFGGKFAGPGGSNFTYTEDQKKKFRQDQELYDDYCRGIETEFIKRFSMFHYGTDEQNTARTVAANILESNLQDEKLASKLTPNFAFGCRRLAPSSEYLQSLIAQNVQVVPKGVIRLTETGVVDETGEHYEVDVVICATGFDTSFNPHFKVIGRQGAIMDQVFKDYPLAYLGVAVEKFPNFFSMIGPNGPVAHGSVIPVLEWYTRYIFQCIEKLQTENIRAMEPKKEAILDLYDHTHELMKRLVFSSTCRSWYKNGKVHGPVTAIYPGSRLHFFEMLDKVRWEDFNITYRSKNRFQFMGNGYSLREKHQHGDTLFHINALSKI